jgi:hypothetical protein
MANERPEWAKKIPRSSRICFRCQHKYSSHVPSCRRIIERNPKRKECDCRTFVKDELELEIVLRQEAGEDRRRKEAYERKQKEKNALIQKEKNALIQKDDSD